MRRAVFTLGAGASLVLLVATVAMWVRSHLVSELWYSGILPRSESEMRAYVLASDAGRFQFIFNVLPPSSSPLPGFYRRGTGLIVLSGPVAPTASPSESWRQWRIPGFEFHRRDIVTKSVVIDPREGFRSRAGPPAPWQEPPKPVARREVVTWSGGRSWTISYWLPSALFAVLPATWFKVWLRRRRHRPGVCRKCSYSLIGNVSGTCPEMFSLL